MYKSDFSAFISYTPTAESTVSDRSKLTKTRLALLILTTLFVTCHIPVPWLATKQSDSVLVNDSNLTGISVIIRAEVFERAKPGTDQ